MEKTGSGRILRIYLGELDKLGNQLLYEALLEKALELNLAGCTVLRGMAGFGGASRQIHRATILRLSEKLPIVMEIVDTEENLLPAVSQFEEMIARSGKGCLMTLEPVEILRYNK